MSFLDPRIEQKDISFVQKNIAQNGIPVYDNDKWVDSREKDGPTAPKKRPVACVKSGRS